MFAGAVYTAFRPDVESVPMDGTSFHVTACLVVPEIVAVTATLPEWVSVTAEGDAEMATWAAHTVALRRMACMYLIIRRIIRSLVLNTKPVTVA
jgi:hypothetical protein